MTDMILRQLSTAGARRLAVPVSRVLDFRQGALPVGVAFSRASSALVPNAAGGLETKGNDYPRFADVTAGGEARGLLLEGAQTNQLFRSETLENPYWTKTRCTVMANNGLAPNDTLTADMVVEDTTATASHFIQRISAAVTTGEVYTCSFYAKPAGRNVVQLVLATSTYGTAAYANFDLVNGVVSAVGSGAFKARMTPAKNGFYRCELTGTTISGSANACSVSLCTDGGAARFQEYTGDGASGALVWGIQFEKHAFATSYIPTTTAAVIRAADVATVPGLAGLNLNAMQGTLLMSTLVHGATGTAQTLWELALDANNRVYVGVTAAGLLEAGAVRAGSSVWQVTGPALVAGAVTRLALRYRQNDWALTVNETVVTTGGSGDVPVLKQLYLGNGVQGTTPAFMTLRRLECWPMGLTDSVLKSVTGA